MKLTPKKSNEKISGFILGKGITVAPKVWVLHNSLEQDSHKMQELHFNACSPASHILYSEYCEVRTSNMTQAQAEETDSKSSKKTLAKISPNQIAADDKDGGKVPQIEDLTSDKAIIEATRLLLRDYGIRKSGAAIRDAIDMKDKILKTAPSIESLVESDPDKEDDNTNITKQLKKQETMKK